MKNVRYHLMVNIFPVILLLSLMATGMVGVNSLLNNSTNNVPVLSKAIIENDNGSWGDRHLIVKAE